MRSSARCVAVLRGALQLRTNFSSGACGPGYSRSDRSRRISWIAGTAVNHVAPTARMSSQNVPAENRPRSGSSTQPLLARDASSAANSPWPWKNGITATVASPGPNS